MAQSQQFQGIQAAETHASGSWELTLLPTCYLRIAAQGYAGQPVGSIFSSVLQYFKMLLTRHIPPVDVVITMGCNVRCPFLPCLHREDWGLEDPSGKSDEAFLETIRLIEEKILDLWKRLK